MRVNKLTKNFTLSELTCRDGTPVPDKYVENAFGICTRAQALRDLIQSPLVVTSGYRSLAHNTKLKAAKKSQHLTASALDLRSDVWSPEQLATLYQGLIDLGVVDDGGLGIYPPTSKRKGWIHIDLGRPRRWRG